MYKIYAITPNRENISNLQQNDAPVSIQSYNSYASSGDGPWQATFTKYNSKSLLPSIDTQGGFSLIEFFDGHPSTSTYHYGFLRGLDLKKDDIIEIKLLRNKDQGEYRDVDGDDDDGKFIWFTDDGGEKVMSLGFTYNNGVKYLRVNDFHSDGNPYFLEIDELWSGTGFSSGVSTTENIITIGSPFASTQKTSVSLCRDKDKFSKSLIGPEGMKKDPTRLYIAWRSSCNNRSSGSPLVNPVKSIAIYTKYHELKHKLVCYKRLSSTVQSGVYCFGFADLVTGSVWETQNLNRHASDTGTYGKEIGEELILHNDTCVSKLLYTDSPSINFVNALDCKLNLKDNAAGSLTFKLPPTHDSYYDIKLRNTYVAVVEDKNEIFVDKLYNLDGRYTKLDYIFSEGTMPCTILPPIDINNKTIEIDFEMSDNVTERSVYNPVQVISLCNTDVFNDSHGGSSLFAIDMGLSNDVGCYVPSAHDLYEIYHYYQPASLNYYGVTYEDIPIFTDVEEIYFDENTDGSSSSSKSKYSAIKTNTMHTLKFGNNSYYLDGVCKDCYLTHAIDPRDNPEDLYIYIGGRKDDKKYGRTRIYEIRIERDDGIHTYIPVFDNESGETMLYDTKSGIAYGSVSGDPWFAGDVSKSNEDKKLIKPIWAGRVMSKTTDFNKNITYKANGLLDMFADHVIKPVLPNNYKKEG